MAKYSLIQNNIVMNVVDQTPEWISSQSNASDWIANSTLSGDLDIIGATHNPDTNVVTYANKTIGLSEENTDTTNPKPRHAVESEIDTIRTVAGKYPDIFSNPSGLQIGRLIWIPESQFGLWYNLIPPKTPVFGSNYLSPSDMWSVETAAFMNTPGTGTVAVDTHNAFNAWIKEAYNVGYIFADFPEGHAQVRAYGAKLTPPYQDTGSTFTRGSDTISIFRINLY